MRLRSIVFLAALVGAAACALFDAASPPDAGSDQVPVDRSETRDAAADPLAAERAPLTPQDGGALPTQHAGPDAVRCGKCHGDADRARPEWSAIAMRVGHDVQAMRGRTNCTCCHLGEVRGFGEPVDQVCTQCHEKVRVTIAAMGGAHCVSCHDTSHAGPNALRESAWECMKCHARDEGHKPAVAVHSTQACSNCHQPHKEPWTLQRNCVDCHMGKETKHGGSEGVLACETCHKPHEVAGAASARCAECHAAREHGKFERATFAGGHDQCTLCHEPHDAPKAPAKDCQSCHAIATMRGRGGDSHAKCASCHASHDVRAGLKTEGGGACVNCHAAVHPDHPDPKGEGCVGCHDPHPKGGPWLADAPATGHATRVACNRCHEKAATDRDFHAGTTACTACHKPHAFKGSSAASCASCHLKEASASAHGGGHKDCAGCHEAHAPKTKVKACESCHKAEASTASAGHADCARCHDAHPKSAAAKAACTTCHQPKAGGPHGQVACGSCHRAHGGSWNASPVGPAVTPPCQSCHAKKDLGSLHASSGHASCDSCHSAHKKPSSDRATCLSCHADRKDHEPTAKLCAGCHAFTKAQ